MRYARHFAFHVPTNREHKNIAAPEFVHITQMRTLIPPISLIPRRVFKNTIQLAAIWAGIISTKILINIRQVVISRRIKASIALFQGNNLDAVLRIIIASATRRSSARELSPVKGVIINCR